MDNTEAIIAIKCLDLLFFNYTESDIDNLCMISREFSDAWIAIAEYDTYGLLWREFCSFSLRDQSAIINYALDRFRSRLAGYAGH